VKELVKLCHKYCNEVWQQILCSSLSSNGERVSETGLNCQSYHKNKSIGHDTKSAAHQSKIASEKQKLRSVERGCLFHYRNSVKNCFSMQNFTDIRRQLAAKKRFLKRQQSSS